MLIMKSADWLLVARPILLVCISLAEIGVSLYQKVGYHLSLQFSFHFLSLFSSIPFLFPLPPLPLPPFVFFPLLSFPFPLHIPSNPARGPGERCKRRLLVEVVITPPPPVILWQVDSQSFSFFKSTSSRQSVIFFTSQSHFFTWLTPGSNCGGLA